MKAKKILKKIALKIDQHTSKILMVPFFLAGILLVMILANVVNQSYAALLPVESLPNHLTSKIETAKGSLVPLRSDFIHGVEEPSGIIKRFYAVDDTGKDFDIYCLDRWLTQIYDVSYTKAQSALEDKGMAYLLSQIYPNNDQFLSGKSEDEKRYISQLTIWYYQDKKAGYPDEVDECNTQIGGVDPVTCKKTGSTAESDTTFYWKNSLLAKEKTLIKASSYWADMDRVITEALNYTENNNYGVSIDRESIKFELTSDEQYMESNLITVSTVGSNFLGYTLSTSDNQVSFYNENGDSIQNGTTVNPGVKFKIRVPIQVVRNQGTLSINVNISGTFSSRDAYMYYPSSEIYQKALVGVMQLTPINAGVNLIIEDPMGSAKIIKKDATTGEALKGATLVLSDQAGTEVARWVSTTEPHVIDPLKTGTYTLREESAPEGYVLNTQAIPVVINKGQLTTVEMENKTRGVGEFRKTDIVTGEEVEGATLIITNDRGQEVTRWVSGKEPHVVTLDDGTYTLTEEIAPEGYIKSSESVTFTITAGKTTPVEMKNEPYGKAKIIKIDSVTKKPLKGATLVVWDANQQEIERFETSEEPYLLENLEEGSYTLTEESAPKGYVKNEEPQTIVIQKGKITTVTMENEPYGTIEVRKIDAETKQPLKGATLIISDLEGAEIVRFESSEEPYSVAIPAGTYILTEIYAPEGYVRSKESIKFDVTQGEIYQIEVTNIKEEDIPDTKASQSSWIYVIGTVILIISLGLIHFAISKKRSVRKV